MVEALGDVAGHFHVLDLVAAYRHFVGVEHEDVGAHEDGVAVEAHFHAVVLVGLPSVEVGLHSGFVGVGAVHQAFGGDAGEYPVELGHFWDVALAVKRGALGVEAAGEPGGGHGLGGGVDDFGVVAFDDAVVVGQKEEGFGGRVGGGGNGGADGADVVAQMRDAGGGYAGEDSFFHGWLSVVWRK